MKLTVLPLAAAIVALAACSDNPVQPIPARRVSPVAAVSAARPGRMVVEFNGPVRGDFAARVAALGGTVDFVADGAGFAGVSGLTTEAAASLGRQGGVGAVYDDVPVQLAAPTRGDAMMAADASITSIASPATSFRFGNQWNMRAINAPAAWAAGNLGSPTVTAAILDTGIDYDSFDMNTMVDLSRSKSFVPSDDAVLGAFFPARNKIDDLNGHGTNVATQVSSNATIFAGVNSKARLVGVKVIGAGGGGSIAGILAGIIWAADHGADVANVSIGIAGGVDKAGNGRFVGLTNKVFNYANRAGMVIVVAAGNDGENLDNNGRSLSVYCEAPHVICVSATGPTASANAFSGPWANVDAPADYSNTGVKSITVSAPGGTAAGLVSSVCPRHLAVASGNTLVFPCNVPPGFFVTLGEGGTSQAAPHVTGVVAQLIAKYGAKNPAKIKQLLLNGVDDLGPPGPDAAYGAGRVNLLKALSQ
jgi:lantibiotic leader peptide-processing serine protease